MNTLFGKKDEQKDCNRSLSKEGAESIRKVNDWSIMKQSQTKKVYIYPIKDTDGTPLDLINVLCYVQASSCGASSDEVSDVKLQLDRVDSFIGRNDRGEYIKVGGTENLSAPGVIFRYASYVREQEMMIGYYLQFYHENLRGLVLSTLRTGHIIPSDFFLQHPDL